jgi:peptidoglycan/xylan/chitin deacetylase (PgdA/CDA1 family)
MTAAIRRLRRTMIGTGFSLFRATGLHRLAAPLTRGCGVVLMFHHVRPWAGDEFALNRGLEIEPDFFETVLRTLRACGFEIINLDTALRRLAEGPAAGATPFAVLTFDDAYRDNLEFALPILRRHAAPFSLFVTTGFVERKARLWWVELEEAVRLLPEICVTIDGERLVYATADTEQKAAAGNEIYWRLRAEPEDVLLDAVGELAARAGIDGRAIVERECMDWQEIGAIAADPLCTIGSHTLSHPRLATCAENRVRHELEESRATLASRLGRPVRHLAYPVGDPTSAGPREFALAAELGYASALTTRPGMIFPEHARHLTALPRLSVNGEWQSRAALEILLSGAPFLAWNRGRRVAA